MDYVVLKQINQLVFLVALVLAELEFSRGYASCRPPLFAPVRRGKQKKTCYDFCRDPNSGTCLRSASACISCEQDAFACNQAAANINDPRMNEHAITVKAAILAICTAVGRVLSLYACKEKTNAHYRIV